MTSPNLVSTFKILIVIALSLLLSTYTIGTAPSHDPACSFAVEKRRFRSSRVFDACIGVILYIFIKQALKRWANKGTSSVYGLQHGRLHLSVPTAMWMNMGFWKDDDTSKPMAEACRNLLNAVLAEAGFTSVAERAEVKDDVRRVKCLIDLGLGCGDQTVYLMSAAPVRSSDEVWWDARERCVRFDYYVGITNDPVQARYASKRIEELKNSGKTFNHRHQNELEGGSTNIDLFCADAAKPMSWSEQLHASVQNARDRSQERWVLALDTAYHFASSRWAIINHANSNIGASFMAFDLCISQTATVTQKLLLRLLTTLMGAPWANFVTPQEYQNKLIQAGYQKDMITIRDISEHVFTPLAQYIEEQDGRLRTLGLGIGSFSLAKAMFGWWGRTGIVRGVIVIAKKSDPESS